MMFQWNNTQSTQQNSIISQDFSASNFLLEIIVCVYIKINDTSCNINTVQFLLLTNSSMSENTFGAKKKESEKERKIIGLPPTPILILSDGLN